MLILSVPIDLNESFYFSIIENTIFNKLAILYLNDNNNIFSSSINIYRDKKNKIMIVLCRQKHYYLSCIVKNSHKIW